MYEVISGEETGPESFQRMISQKHFLHVTKTNQNPLKHQMWEHPATSS